MSTWFPWYWFSQVTQQLASIERQLAQLQVTVARVDGNVQTILHAVQPVVLRVPTTVSVTIER